MDTNRTHHLIETRKDILLKAWELTQLLAKNNAESAWKVKITGLTLWAALISYGFQQKIIFIIMISIIILIPIFLVEIGFKIIEYKIIEKSHDLETAINSILHLDDLGSLHTPPEGVKTSITPFSRQDFNIIFKAKRWLIWFPYIFVIIISIITMIFICCNSFASPHVMPIPQVLLLMHF